MACLDHTQQEPALVTLPTFKAFLSHRYKSPGVNQRFFDLLAAQAHVQFEVDVGSKPTNVTRLERFVRDADAFVGIYPFPSTDDARPSREAIIEESKYFRLELDLAIRSGRPGIVFVDQRYGNAISVPPSLRECRFDHREVDSSGPLRHEASFRDQARAFVDDVGASMRWQAGRGRSLGSDRVGLMLPASAAAASGQGGGCSAADIEQIADQLRNMSLNPVHLDMARGADGDFMRQIDGLDWVVSDIGAAACAGGMPALLHGRFVPQVRLVRSPVATAPARSPLEDGILKPFEAGYPKDIVRWHDGQTLLAEFVKRLSVLYEPRKHIGSAADAQAYFASASLRKETVFLSYSGEDRARVEGVAQALRRVFQNVFDYRDQGQSIVPGNRWIEEIFDKLSGSALAVPLVSADYFASENCKHEAREIMALADSRKIRVVPVKLRDGPLELPSWMRDIQYLRGWEYAAPEVLTAKIVAAFDTPARGATSAP
jgi:hypothetical protein